MTEQDAVDTSLPFPFSPFSWLYLWAWISSGVVWYHDFDLDEQPLTQEETGQENNDNLSDAKNTFVYYNDHYMYKIRCKIGTDAYVWF